MPRLASLDPADYALPAEVRDQLLSPALVIYLDRVRDNVRTVLALTRGPERWRPHVKTTKTPEIFQQLVREGVRRFKCATTRELDVLLQTLDHEGVSHGDVLVAYPLVGPALGALHTIASRHPQAKVSVLCEDAQTAAQLPANIGVFVDVNPGMHRTGLPLSARESIHAVAAAAGPRFRGVHFYDGHLHGELAQRRTQAFEAYDGLMQLVQQLGERGIQVAEIITSGTPTFRLAMQYTPFESMEGCLHQVSPGTVVLHDQRSEEENPDLDLAPAALLFSRIVSQPKSNSVTCDAGAKSISADAGDPAAFALGRPELVAQPPSEEHLPLQVTSGPTPQRGDELLLVPRHVCTTVNLAEQILLMEGGKLRGVASVAARAHPLFADDLPSIRVDPGAPPRGSV